MSAKAGTPGTELALAGFAFICSLALALYGHIYASAAVFVVSSAAFGWLNRGITGRSRLERDAAQFLGNLVRNCSVHSSTLKIVSSSLNPKFCFCGEFSSAPARYRESSSAMSAFSGLLAADSTVLRETARAVMQSLDWGFPLRQALLEIRRQSATKADYIRRSSGSVMGSSSLVRIGSAVFFPIFAGMSLGILRVSSAPAGPDLGKLALLFASYIVLTNFMGSVYQGKPGALLFCDASFASALAILVFKASSIVSINAI